MANGDFSEKLATVRGLRLPSKWAHCLLLSDVVFRFDRLSTDDGRGCGRAAFVIRVFKILYFVNVSLFSLGIFNITF